MILVIGCGYVGMRVADSLHAGRILVTGVTHSEESAAEINDTRRFPAFQCDVSDPKAVQDLAAKLNADQLTIIHCASSGRGGAESYRRVFLRGCDNLHQSFPSAHLLFTSSSSVYPQTDGTVVTEESDASPDRETSQVLRETEDLVLSRGGCVARLAGIYGPGRSFVLKNFLEGTATIEGNDGAGRCLNQIHRDDAAKALVHLAITAQQGIFNVVDDVPMTQLDCFTELARRFGRPLPPSAAPDTSRKRAWTHKRLSNAKLRASGWSPRYPGYFDALDHDPELVSSILAQVEPMRES